MTFYEKLTEAINHFVNNGYTDKQELDEWTTILIIYFLKNIFTKKQVKKKIDKSLKDAYKRVIKKHKNEIKNRSELKQELERRINASDSIIDFAREEMTNKMARAFTGWASSIPKGGSKNIDKNKEKKDIRKTMTKLQLAEKRIVMDQIRKMRGNMEQMIAVSNDAIAAQWHSNWRVPGYNYRIDHKHLDERIYLIRGSKPLESKLIKPVSGYVDDEVLPGELPNCKCYYRYIYDAKDLPKEFLTVKGKKTLNI